MYEDRSDNLEERFIRFGGRIAEIASACMENRVGRHLGDQILRSGTAVGAHYAEAKGAQSRNDFIHKVSRAGKEAREAHYWLRLIERADVLEDDLRSTIQEANELVAILYASMQTARKNRE